MPYLKNLRQVGYMLLFLASCLIFFGCKKNIGAVPVGPAPTPDTLGQYGVTEVGNLDSLELDPNLNRQINGYTDKVSYNPGDLLTLYLSGPNSMENKTITLNNTQGVTILSVAAHVTTQPIKNKKPWVDGFGYPPAFTIRLPANLKSGIYTWMGRIPFICRGNNENHDITVVYPSNTFNAYNFEGGKSIYAPNYQNRATVVSFLRSNTINYFDFYKWLDMQHYDINYIADSDLDNYSQIQNSKIVMITGHSEYWTRLARENIDKFVASGKNVLMLSGNNMWAQVRYNTSKHLMICYKSLTGAAYDSNTQDPLKGTLYSTIYWGIPAIDYPIVTSIGAEYRNGGYGNTLPGRTNGYRIVQQNSPLFGGTGLANGELINVQTREYDGAPMLEYYSPGSLETPVIDTSKLHCYKVELLAFDYAQDLIKANRLGYGTFILFKKTATSGTVVNVATMDWVEQSDFEGPDGDKLQTITKNMIDLSLANASLFSKQ